MTTGRFEILVSKDVPGLFATRLGPYPTYDTVTPAAVGQSTDKRSVRCCWISGWIESLPDHPTRANQQNSFSEQDRELYYVHPILILPPN